MHTQPSSIVNLDDLAEALEIYDVDRELLDHITFSGNGEATLHPEFRRAVDVITAFRNRSAPQAKTAILSNSSQVHRPEIREAILKLDRRLMKIDAGDQATFSRVNRPPAQFSFDAMVSGLKALGDFETQTIFVDGSISNSHDSAVKSWLGVMLELKPQAVQIYTLARPPADSELKAVSRERMNAIFLQAKKAGLRVTLY
jgi:wyosine [tRNA(Phe)-imidazoG37] synthetase (radical SAM superfamily)